MPLAHFKQGRRHQVLTYRSFSGRDDVGNYLDSLQRTDRAKMMALLAIAADEGPPFSRPDRCRPLKGEPFNEFKTHGHRILWTFLGEQIVLLTAFEKKQDRTPSSALIRGRNAYDRMMAEAGGELDGD